MSSNFGACPGSHHRREWGLLGGEPVFTLYSDFTSVCGVL